MTISVTAAETALLTTDTDGDGVADPGETLTYSVTITNTSNAGEILTGVQFEQLLSGVTLVPGSINVSPLANNDAFSAVGNTLLEVGNATAQTGPQSSFAGNLFSNDTEFLGDTFTLSTYDSTSANGGQVAVNADGTFTYLSAAGFTGADTFTYTLTDGDGLTSTATVTITVADQVWYVDANYGGANGASDGTSLRPFTTVTAAGAQSGASDFVYVQGNAGGTITLNSGEQLIGTGVDLVVGGNTLATATANSTIAGNAAGPIVQLNAGNTIAGIDIANSGTGIVLGGTAFGTLTVNDVALDGAGQALFLHTGAIAGSGFNSTDSDGGSNNVFLTDVTGNLNLGGGALSGASGVGVLISGGNGSVDYNGTVTHSGNAQAIQVLSKTGGTVDFDGAVTSNGSSDGVSLTGNTGATISFDGGLTIDTSASGTAGFTATGGGTVNVVGGSNTINAASIALDLSGVTAGMSFSQVTSSAGTTGISLNNMSGALNIGSVTINGQTGDGIDVTNSSGSLTITGGTIGNSNDPGGVGVDINGGTGAVSIGASITKTTAGKIVDIDAHNTGAVTFSGALSATGAVDNGIQLSNSSGTIAFTNASKVLSTGNFNGVTLTNNFANVDFTGGGLTITTTGGTGISAGTASTFTGGTLTVSGSGNTIASTTGSAFVMNGTDSDGITFQSISKNGGTATGIFLKDAGTGGFTVTGTGSTASSGGTIQNIDDGGINGASAFGLGAYIDGTSNVSLGNMQFSGTIANFAIRGVNVSNFTLRDSVISGTMGDTSGSLINLEGGIYFNNLTGVGLFEGNSISGGFTDNMRILNDNPGSSTLNLFVRDSANDAAVFGSTGTTNSGNDSLNVEAQMDNNIFMLVDGVQFTGWRGDGIQAQALNTANLEVTVQNSTFFNSHPNIASGGGIGVLISGTSGGGSWGVDYTIQDNQFTGSKGYAIAASFFGAAGTARGFIDENTIGTAGGGYTGSGSSEAGGILVRAERSGLIGGTLTHLATISDNTIRDVNDHGINVGAVNGSSLADNAVVEATINNNTVSEMGGASSIAGLYMLAGGNDPDFGILRADINNNVFNIAGTTNAYAPVYFDQIFGTSAKYEFPSYGGQDGESYGGTGSASAETYLQGRGNTLVNDDAPLTGDTGMLVFAFDAVMNPGTLQTAQTGSNTQLPSGAIEAAAPPPPAPEAPADTAEPSSPGPQPDLAPSGPAPSGPVVVDDGVVSAAELAFIVEAAIARWAAAGATAEQIAAMEATAVSVSELGALQLGASKLGTIVIDDNAAGWNWFVDATPGEDGEYAGTGTRLAAVDASGQAGTRIDLLTVLMHELGHQIGLADEYNVNEADDLMFGSILAGERRLPGADDAAGAVPTTGDAPQFIGAPIVIGTLNPGQSLTIQWQATIDAQSNGLIVDPTNSGTVSWTGPSAGSQGTNSVVTTIDTLTLGNRVFLDANASGIYDAGDSGIDGVALTLFADTGTVAGSLDAGDAQIATTASAGDGFYSFAGLAPGDYIVRIDAANFTAGGALEGRLPTTNAGDPDNNFDNDSNGGPLTGGVVSSAAITLAYNTEPTAGPGNDTNNTLDFGIVDLNEPPVNTVPGTQTINEDATLTFTGGTAISVSDPDVGAGNLTVTLSLTQGQLTLSGTAGLAFSTGDGTDDGTMTFTGTQAAINAALDGLLYETTTDANGTDTLTIVTNDNGNTGTDPGTSGGASDEQDSDTVTINITAVADIAADSPTVNEDSGANNLDLLANDSFENPGRAITAVGAALHGTTSIDDNGTPGDATDDFVVYTPTGNFNGSDSFTYTVTSGGVTEQATATVAVTAINDAPVVIGDGTEDAATIVEDAPSSTGETVSALFSGQYSDAADGQFGVGNPGGSSPGSFGGIAVVANGSSGATGQWQYFDTGTSTWVDVGAVAANNALLIGSGTSIRFNPAPNFNGAAPTLTAHLIDNSLGFGITFGQHADISGVGATGGTTAYSTGTVVLSQAVTPDGNIDGTAGNDTLTGTPGNDFFDVSQGGDDILDGLGGDDGFYFGAALTAADSVDGGTGNNDQVGLQGAYAGLVLGANNLVNVETLVLLPGNDTRFGDTSGALYDYDITTVDANVATGQRLTVNFNTLRVGEDVAFDGSAETDGSFLTFGGQGNDTLIGGQQSDGFYFGSPNRWGAGDSVDGQGGADDQLGLQGNYSGASAITFGAGQITGIETIVLLTGGDLRFGTPPGVGYSYDVTMHDGNLAAAQTMTVNANTLRANVPGVTDETLTFDGSAELDGNFNVYGGAGADTIIGGAGNDRIYGAGGADVLTGGLGNDVFAYLSAAHSTPAARDTILDFTSGDSIDLSVIDANTLLGGDQAFSFIGSAAFAGTGAASAGELRFESAGGADWLVQGDTDGNGVADYEIYLTVSDADPITSADFVL